MRVVLLLVLLGTGAVAYWVMQRDPEAERARLAAELRDARAEIGVRKLLAASDGYTFRHVVIGTMHPEGAVDFRAMAVENEAMRPTFGRAEPVCADRLEEAACWRIGLLEIDGRTVLAGEPGDGATAEK